MDCPKCGAAMQLGKLSVETKLTKVFGGSDHAVHELAFIQEGSDRVFPRLDGAAWMCADCDTLVLVGGW